MRLRIDTNNVEVRKCDDHLEQLCQYCNEAKRELENKRDELKQSWIPYLAPVIIKKEKEEIPRIINRIGELEQKRKDIHKEREQHLEKNKRDDKQIIDLQNQISSFQIELKEIIDSISIVYKKIVLHINTMTYLSILHQRMETFYYHGGTDAKVMAVLDKSPEVMEYDDDVYFKLLEQWNLKMMKKYLKILL